MMTSRTVLFHREFRGFTGGHLKVWHYFGHAASAADHDAAIYFTAESSWDPTNPWHAARDRVRARYDPRECEVLFVAGLDWLALEPEARAAPPRPVVNLVQHVRHADPADPRHQFLTHPAVRVCVSEEVADAICATGLVRGPVITIPNGCDLDVVVAPGDARSAECDVLVAAAKAPDLGRWLASRLEQPDRRVVLLDALRPREVFLDALRSARVVVALPDRTEGFFLPALEAMALGCLVVVPDCVGNRSFCIDGDNCWRPPYDSSALLRAAEDALASSADEAAARVAAALSTARAHSLEAERDAFHRVLADLASGGLGAQR